MRRVCVSITARPSYSRIKSALAALKQHDVELQIIAAASATVTRFGRIADQIRADGFEVTAEVSSVVEEDSLANSALSTGVLLTQMAGTLQRLKPDVVVTIADRHETLATAIAASYQHIPLVHVQGGEVTGSIDDKVRNAITQLADEHYVSTRLAALRVSRMKPGARVTVTGCPSIDLAINTRVLLPRSGIVVVQHPVTNEADLAGSQMRVTISALSGLSGVRYFWPGEDSGGSVMAKELRSAKVRPTRNLPSGDFLSLVSAAQCVVGNSSVGIRECSYFGTPVVNIGTRQEGRERAENVVDVPHSLDAIREAVERQVAHGPYPQSTLYGDGHAGERIAALLAGKRAERAA